MVLSSWFAMKAVFVARSTMIWTGQLPVDISGATHGNLGGIIDMAANPAAATNNIPAIPNRSVDFE
jgi:hypothetical protein